MTHYSNTKSVTSHLSKGFIMPLIICSITFLYFKFERFTSFFVSHLTICIEPINQLSILLNIKLIILNLIG